MLVTGVKLDTQNNLDIWANVTCNGDIESACLYHTLMLIRQVKIL